MPLCLYIDTRTTTQIRPLSVYFFTDCEVGFEESLRGIGFFQKLIHEWMMIQRQCLNVVFENLGEVKSSQI